MRNRAGAVWMCGAGAGLLGLAACARADFWVDAGRGSDSSNGLTSNTAFRTIQHAADAVTTGTVIHILPGIYRETVAPPTDGQGGRPLVFRGESATNDVIVSGAVSSKDLAWTRLAANTIGLPASVAPSNVFWADLSGWTNLPEIAVWDHAGVRTHLPKAREPDWSVTTDWKYHENWWKADGGDSYSLVDLHSDTPGSYPDVQAGHLGAFNGFATAPVLTGAVLFATDGVQGHYTYRRPIAAHNPASGTVQFAAEASSGISSNTKYFVEGVPALLDVEGEWCVVSNTTPRLYLWPPGGQHPTNLTVEIARRGIGFNLRNRSNLTLEHLTIRDVNDLNGGYSIVDGAIWISNWSQWSTNLVFDRLTIRDCGVGMRLYANAGLCAISNLVLRHSEIAYCEGPAIQALWEPGGTPPRAGITTLRIETNDFHHLGFRPRTDQGIGLSLGAPRRVLFRGNRVHDVMQNGVQFIAGSNSESAVVGNLFERCGQGAADCAGFKLWADESAVSDLLVMGNVLRDTRGWTYAVSQINWWDTTRGRFAGFGAYADLVRSDRPGTNAVTFYRNVATSNGFAGIYVAHSRDVALFNNVCAGSPFGISLDGKIGSMADFNTNNCAKNNLLLVDGASTNGYTDAGLVARAGRADAGRLALDYNVYRLEGVGVAAILHYTNWDSSTWRAPLLYTNLAQVRAMSPWEANGTGAALGRATVVGAASNDYALPLNSAAVDAGTAPQAALELAARLEGVFATSFGGDAPYGARWDAGAEECVPEPFRVAAVEAAAAGPVLRWEAVPGALYAVQACGDLGAGNWSAGTQVGAAGYAAAWTNTSGVASSLFLRVRLDGPDNR